MPLRLFPAAGFWALSISLFCSSADPSLALAEQPARRIWKDSTGQFSIEAELLGRTSDAVRLRGSDGREVTVPIQRLSAPDQKYLRSLQDPAAELFGENKSTAAGGAASETFRALPESASVGEQAELPFAGPAIDISGAPVERSFEPDPEGSVASLPTGTVELDSVDMLERISPPTSVDVERTKFLVSLAPNRPGRDRGTRGRIFLVDAKDQSKAVVWNRPQSFTVLDHDPASGRTLLLQGLDRTSRSGALVVVEGLVDRRPKALYRRLLPSEERPQIGHSAPWVRLLSGSHAAAIVDGYLLVWDLAASKPVYRIKGVTPRNPPAFTANQAYMAVPQDGSVVIVHAATGEICGRFETKITGTPGVAFHPDGRRLLLCASNQYAVWVCVNQSPLRQVTTTAVLGGHPVQWVGDELFLSASGRLVDVELGMDVWHYRVDSMVQPVVQGNQLLVTTSRDQCDLLSLPIPHPTAKASREDLSKVDDDKMLMRPGSAVAIDVSRVTASGGNEMDSQAVRATLVEAARRAGWEVRENAPVRLVASAAPENRTIHVRTSGPRMSEARPVSVTVDVATVALRHGDETLWARTTDTRIPFTLLLRPGEAIDQRIKQFNKVDPNFFSEITLPPRIPKPELQATIGHSKPEEGRWQDYPAAGANTEDAG